MKLLLKQLALKSSCPSCCGYILCWSLETDV